MGNPLAYTQNLEIRALLRGWKNYLNSPIGKQADKRYRDGIQACIDALEAVLGPDKEE